MMRRSFAALLVGASVLASAQAHAAGTHDQASSTQVGRQAPTQNPVAVPNPSANAASTPAPDDPSLAQPTASGTQTPAQTTQASAEVTTQDIIVTGSRVTNGNNSPTPVTVFQTEQFQKLQPGTITEAVNLLPALQGSQNLTSRPGGGQRNGAGAYFTLRNLGNLRTLVLYDGLRLIPTINQNEADTDASIVPQMLIKRVDVVTGGVAAVYGSDAISGVINFITDRDFEGIKLQASNGVSTYGDDPIFNAGIAVGKKFAGGRGHFEASYEYRNDPGLLSRTNTDRAFFAQEAGGAGNGTTIPYYNIPNQLMSNTTYGGLLTNVAGNGALRDLMFTPNGTLTPFVHGLVPTANGLVPYSASVVSSNANIESGGSGAYYQTASLKAGLQSHQAFGRLDYELTDSIHAYAQLSYSDIHTFNNYQSPLITGTISNANPFLSSVQAPYAAILAANPTGTLTFSRLFLNEPRADQYTEAYIAYGGVDGTLGGFKWNVNYGHSQSVIRAVNDANYDNGKLFAALDSVSVGGQTVCRASLTNSAYAGCEPLNLFGSGRASQAALDYIGQQTYSINRTRLDNVTASIAGSPFSTWAGPVNVALSGEYRSLTWDVRSNASPNDLANCTGIAYNCTAGRTGQWFFVTMGALAPVTQRVEEGALEVDVPLVKDVRFLQAVNVTGAVRYTNYNTSGGATTWKVGGDWKLSDDLRFRVTRSRDIRAPNLFELYSPLQINPNLTVNDPYSGQSNVRITNYQTSNPNLTPEKANTFTAGAVFTPRFLPGFSLSVDYYRITVDNVIFLLQGFSTAVLNICGATRDASPICTNIQRNGAGVPVSTTTTYLNIASLKTYGIDTEANYHFDLFRHPLSLRALVTYQPQLIYDQGPAGVLSVAGTYNTGTNRIAASPKWKVTGVVSYSPTDKINVTVLERWRDSLQASALPANFQNATLPPLAYTNINVSLNSDSSLGHMEWYLNVSNVFNKFPTVYYTGPVTSPGLAQNIPEGDDPIGRYFTVGARFKF